MDNDTPPVEPATPQAPPQPPAPPAPAPAPALPAAAKTVIEMAPEDLARLKQQVEEKDSALKNRELEIAKLEDENRRLKTSREPRPRKSSSRWTLLHDED